MKQSLVSIKRTLSHPVGNPRVYNVIANCVKLKLSLVLWSPASGYLSVSFILAEWFFN